jgi:hypothetical protein
MSTHSLHSGLALLLACFVTPSIAQEIDNRAIYLLANSIADDVELIREVMGRPYDDSPRLPASEVSLGELFLQTQTLFRKSNQLAQEAGVAERQSAPAAASVEIQPIEIYRALDSATEQIALVKEVFGITEVIEPLRRESSISTTGIFMTIIDVNRQLNLMLNESIRASDVFDRVALVNVYAAGIIDRLAPGAPLPQLPAISGHYRPANVYGRLLECIEVVSRIAQRVEGVQVMSLSSRRNIPDDIEPGHVYDIAQILVADVASIAVALDAVDTPSVELPVPDRIFPTQVYQRASLLLRQLERIENLL